VEVGVQTKIEARNHGISSKKKKNPKTGEEGKNREINLTRGTSNQRNSRGT